MDIRCERCKTEYEFDEHRLTEAGVTVKCTTCGHVFKVRRPAAGASLAALRLRRAGQPLAAECPDLATLQRWVVERRMLRDDELSLSGGAWRRLGELPELAPFFDLVAAAEHARPAVPPPPAAAPTTQQMVAPHLAMTDPSLAPVAPAASADPYAAAPTQRFAAAAPTASTQQFLAPSSGSLPPAAPAATMQFRTPSAAVDAPPPAASTLRFQAPGLAMPAADPYSAQTVQVAPTFAPPSPAATIPFQAPVPAATMQVRVPAAAAPTFGAPEQATSKFAVAPGPVSPSAVTLPGSTAPQGALPADADAQSTLQFRVPQMPRSLDLTPAMSIPRPADLAAITLPPSAPPAPAVSRPPPATTEAFRLPEPKPAPAPAPAAHTLDDARPLPRPEYGDRDDDEIPQSAPPPARAPVGEINREPVREAPRAPLREPAPEPVRKPAASEPAWARGDVADDDEEDPEILALKRRGRGARVAMLAFVVVAVLGAAGWFVVWPRIVAAGPVPAEAQAELDRARQIYLAHALAEFPKADQAFHKAIELAGPVRFPAAYAADSELHSAWAERLLDDAKDDPAKAAALTADAKKQLDLAFQAALKVRELEPEGVAADRALVDYYRIARDPQAATYVKRVEKAAAQDPETRAHLGAYWSRDPATAAAGVAALEEAVKLLPSFVRARYWLASAAFAKGDKEAALAQMRDILKVSPAHERAQAYVRGAEEEALAAERAKAEAAAAEAAATAAAGGEGAAAVPAAASGAAPAKVEPAKAEPAKAEPAKTVPAKAEPAKAEPAKAEPAKADKPAAVVASTSEKKPVDVDKLVEQANTQLEKGRPEKALELYDEALAAKPKNADALYGKGLALFELERTDKSIAAFKEALALSPRFGDAMVGLAEVYKQKGQTKEAVRWYQKYLEVMPDGDQANVARTNIERLGR